MRTARGIGLGTGLFVAAMVTAALIAILYFGWTVIGLPFAPFDVFDWLTRVLPGRVIATGIHTMVVVIRGLHLGPTATAAKAAEQAMGIIGLFATGLVAGMILFGVVRALRGRNAVGLGLAFGLAVGVPIVLISHQVGRTATTPPAANVLWLVGVFLIWGLVLGRTYWRLVPAAGTAAIPGQKGGEATVAAEQIDRRRFLVRLGSSTAAITVVGAVVGELAEARHRKMMPAGPAGELWSSMPMPRSSRYAEHGRNSRLWNGTTALTSTPSRRR